MSRRMIVNARAMTADAIGAGAGSLRRKYNKQTSAAGEAENGTDQKGDGRARTMRMSDQAGNEADEGSGPSGERGQWDNGESSGDGTRIDVVGGVREVKSGKSG